MRATGITRNIDPLGRVTIPKEMRRSFELREGDPVEFFVDHNAIVLRPYALRCAFCGETYNLVELRGQKACRKCVAALGAAALRPDDNVPF